MNGQNTGGSTNNAASAYMAIRSHGNALSDALQRANKPHKISSSLGSVASIIMQKNKMQRKPSGMVPVSGT